MLIVIGILITGCTPAQKQYGLDTADLAVQTGLFKTQYGNVEQILREKQASDNMFTDVEWRKLLNTDASIDMLLLKADAIIQLNPDSISLADVEMMYNIAKSGYEQAYQVISSKYKQFDPSTRIQLDMIHSQAESVDKLITKLMEDPTNKNITQTLTLITGVLGLAVKMISIAVL